MLGPLLFVKKAALHPLPNWALLVEVVALSHVVTPERTPRETVGMA